MIRVTVWNEFRHEKASKEVAAIYPNGLHATIAEFLGKNDDIECRLACLDDSDLVGSYGSRSGIRRSCR